MTMTPKQEKVPRQRKGASSDISHTVRASSEQESKQLYEKARTNLLNINRWQQLAGKLSASFTLTDPEGKNADRLPLQGDYIRIHLPSSADGKYDWVRIEEIEEEKSHSTVNWVTIRVRPSEAPRKQEDTEHFFSNEATSSFSVERKGTEVEASVQGRNELPNTEADGLLEKIRNGIIALGAMAGLSTPQWKALVKGILHKKK